MIACCSLVYRLYRRERHGNKPSFRRCPATNATLAGEIEALDARLGQLRADLVHLDAAIRIKCPDAEPELIRPRKPSRKRCDWFGRQELLRLALERMREAERPLSCLHSCAQQHKFVPCAALHTAAQRTSAAVRQQPTRLQQETRDGADRQYRGRQSRRHRT